MFVHVSSFVVWLLILRPIARFIVAGSWYDKLQVIVCKDGTAGCNFEHSAVDGHTVLRLLSDIFVDRSCSILSSGSNAPREEPAGRIIKRRGERSLDALPEHLDFDLPQEIVDSIRSAEVVLSDRLSTFDTVILEFKGFGKCLVTSRKMSPDAAVQMAMIIAHHRLCGRVACVYESVLTKSYYHGRTEAMRSATPSAKRLCEMWVGATSTEAEIMSALRDAATQHSRLVAECAKGYGVDRHLFSLKRIAELTGFKTPAFFESEAWRALNHTTLSTSNCGSHALRLVGFGPAVSDGFGIGYTIKENAISFSVSSKSGQSQRYVLALSNTLAEMEALLRKQDKC
jgi:carnitine O-acetyltransferase